MTNKDRVNSVPSIGSTSLGSDITTETSRIDIVILEDVDEKQVLEETKIYIIPKFLSYADDYRLAYQLTKELEGNGKQRYFKKHNEEGLFSSIKKSPQRLESLIPILEKLRHKLVLEDEHGIETKLFCFADGNDYREPRTRANKKRGKKQNIVSLFYMGETRSLLFRSDKGNSEVSLPVENGTLLFFNKEMEAKWGYGVEKVASDMNLGGTYQCILWGFSSLLKKQDVSQLEVAEKTLTEKKGFKPKKYHHFYKDSKKKEQFICDSQKLENFHCGEGDTQSEPILEMASAPKIVSPSLSESKSAKSKIQRYEVRGKN
eukprot:snap_masked-scaffold_2-processed-gene-23.23-mRNA-1 protein AED:1.00 eAED:1.00 QI:0/0/0/0/1/1/3/0/316